MPSRNRYIFLIIIFGFVGLLHVYPDLRFILETGKDFKGISLMGAGDETVYLSRIEAVIYRNDLRLANVGTYEHRNDPIYQPSLLEVVEGTVARWFGLGAWQIDILATFFLPFILCYLFYLLVNSLSGSFKLAVITVLAIMCGYYWITPNLKAIFKLSPLYFTLPILFVRPISPQFHFMPFIFSLYLIYRISSYKRYYLSIFTGMISGALFYTTIYYWTFVYSGLISLAIINLFKHKGENVKKYLLTLLVASLIGIPYYMSFMSLNRLPHFLEIFKRGGGIFTHQPIIPIIEILFLIFLVLLSNIFTDEKKEVFYYMLSFVLGGLVCLNQQVITGKTVEPFHWEIFTNKIFIIICFFVCVSFMLRWLKKAKYVVPILNLIRIKAPFYAICFMFFAIAFFQQNLYYRTTKDDFYKLQVMAPVLKYIHRILPSNTVILTDPFKQKENQLINVFTKNYPYISGSFFITSAIEDKEVEERYFAALNFYAYSVLEAESLFSYKNGGLFRGMQVHPKYGGTREKNNAYINSLKARYARLLVQNQQDPVAILKKYKVDYVLLTKENQGSVLRNDRIRHRLELEYKDANYALYRISG